MNEVEHRQRERVIEVMERNTDAAERMAAAIERLAVVLGGKAPAEAPPLVAAPEVATLAHGQSKQPVAPPTPGPTPLRMTDEWLAQWGKAQQEKARQQDADAEPEVVLSTSTTTYGSDVPAKACEPWCGASLATPPAPSVLAWSNDTGWWCSVACKRSGRPRSATTETRPAPCEPGCGGTDWQDGTLTVSALRWPDTERRFYCSRTCRDAELAAPAPGKGTR